MGIEAVPEILTGHRIPGPVGLLGVEKDDAGAVVFLVVIGPDIEVAGRRAGLGLARALEPRVLVRGVVDDQFGNHPQATFVGLGNETLGIGQSAVVGVHATVFGDVIAIVASWRGVERQQPDGVDAQIGNVIEFGDKAGKVADPVIVGVEKRLNVNLVDHRILVPERVFDEGG